MAIYEIIFFSIVFVVALFAARQSLTNKLDEARSETQRLTNRLSETEGDLEGYKDELSLKDCELDEITDERDLLQDRRVIQTNRSQTNEGIAIMKSETKSECWSWEGDSFNHNDLEQLIEDHLDSIDEFPAQETVYRGISNPVTLGDVLPSADSLFEWAQDQAYSIANEYSDDWTDRVANALKKDRSIDRDLQALLSAWFKKHGLESLGFYTVSDIEKVKVTIYEDGTYYTPHEACIVCKQDIQGYDPEYCCSGLAEECGCMGRPTNPPICSDKCYQELICDQASRPYTPRTFIPKGGEK